MPNFLDVAAGVVTVPKDGYGTETALNVGPGSLYYKAGSTVSSGSNDGTLASGSSLSLTGPTSFVAVSQGARLVVSDPQYDEAASLAASVGQPGGVAGPLNTDGTAPGKQMQARVPALLAFGHSLISGVGVSSRRNRMSTRLAAMLGATEFNYAKASTYFGSPSADDITPRTLQVVNPSVASGQGSSTSSRSASVEFQPAVQVALVWGGGNDAGVQASVDSGYTSISEGIKACACRLRAAAKFENDHASVVFAQGTGAANWASVASGLGSGTNVVQSGDNGNTVMVTVPSYFPGGELSLSIVTPNAGGCVYTITLDGVSQTSWDTRGAGLGFEPRTYRMLGLAAGAHTIVLTVTNRTGTGDYFDTYQWPDPTYLPVVLIPNMYHAPSYPGVDHTTTNAEVTTINGLIQAACAQFTDGLVVYVDTDTALGNNANYFYSDGVHLNDAGAGVAAKACYDAFVARWPTPAALARAQSLTPDAVQAIRIPEQASTVGKKTARMGVATLAAGTKTVTNEVVTSSSRLFLARATTGGTVGHLSYTITAGTSFTITSSSATETSTINWLLVEPVT